MTPPGKKSPRGPVTRAAGSGDERKLLLALRARAAKLIDDPTTRATDATALIRQLREIAKELKALDAKGGGDPVSDAAATPDEEWPASGG